MWKHHIFTHENDMLFSQVKRSPLPWIYKKLCLSLQKWNGLVFNWCLYNKYTCRTLNDCLEIQNYSFCIEKDFSTLGEKFRISTRPCQYPLIISLYLWMSSLFKSKLDTSIWTGDTWTRFFVCWRWVKVYYHFCTAAKQNHQRLLICVHFIFWI